MNKMISATQLEPSAPFDVSSLRKKAFAGIALLACGVGDGVIVKSEGPTATGELGLEISLSHGHSSMLTAIARLINIGLSPIAGLVIVAIISFALTKLSRRAAALFLSITIFTWLGASAIKPIFARTRPPADRVHALVHETAADSFPSGHTALALAIVFGAFFAARNLGYRGWRILWIGFPSAGLVAASRLYLGAHYLGDVIGSFFFVSGFSILGWAIIPVIEKLTSNLQNRNCK